MQQVGALFAFLGILLNSVVSEDKVDFLASETDA